MSDFWWLPYWWRVDRVTELPRCVYSVSINSAGNVLNYPDNSYPKDANGSRQPKEANKITSATFDLSEEISGVCHINPYWLGNPGEDR